MNIVYNNINREDLPLFLKNNYFKNDIKILEIGVYEGSYASKINEAFPNSSLHLLDTWDTNDTDFYYSARPKAVESAFEVANSRFKNNKNITFIVENSNVAHKKYDKNFFDWIYIDADHSYEAVLSDLNNWYPKLKSNGIMSGHDWNPNPDIEEFDMFGVEKALDEFSKNKNIDLNLTNEQFYKSWFFKKN